MQDRPDNSMPPIVIDCQAGDSDQLLAKEWLLANDIGAYASSTVVGCNTRRYHSLLVGATAPPTGRIAALSSVMERLIVGGQSFDLSVNQFGETLAGSGMKYMVEFRNDAAPTFVFQIGNVRLTKEIVLAQSANVVALRYTITGSSGQLELSPLSAMRDFHQLRRADSSQFTSEIFENKPDGEVVLRDAKKADSALYMSCRGAQFVSQALWWHNFHYRVELARGQDANEDLYTPGKFVCHLSDGGSCQFTAALNESPELDFETTLNQRRAKLKSLADSAGPRADQVTRRLAQASDTFIVRRKLPDGSDSATIIAGYHWFADWGRDAFIALPGLLLSTGRFDLAREVFSTFARYQDGGLIPNRFDDYTSKAHYNSVDASLWFIIAAERYLAATGNTNNKNFWRRLLMPKALTILECYQAGEQFDIHADTDSLLWAGSAQTQLTWMDAATDGQAVTPRYGKAVEINALWYNAHKILAHRCAEDDPSLGRKFALRAETIAESFVKMFWNERTKCLLDCVNDQGRDESIRPNQIFALCLPHSPLPEKMQASVVRIITKHLLTPTGLRTLSPDDSRYHKQYTGLSPEQRDRAYHQGTVWAFLMGPFIEAYLKVNHRSPLAIAQAKHWLMTLDDHLSQAGLGFVSEVFDGDGLHQPGGCIAQAWSVAELLRIKKLITDKR